MPKLLTCSFLIVLFATTIGAGNKPNLRWCFSDTRLIADGSLVTGSGSILLVRRGKIYKGIFQQLLSDSGDSGDNTSLRNLKVNEANRTISFEVEVITNEGSKRIEKVTGKFVRHGLKLFWRSPDLVYGTKNPFMREIRCGKWSIDG